eukprot:2977556-Rhodomonas_salina.1
MHTCTHTCAHTRADPACASVPHITVHIRCGSTAHRYPHTLCQYRTSLSAYTLPVPGIVSSYGARSIRYVKLDPSSQQHLHTPCQMRALGS